MSDIKLESAKLHERAKAISTILDGIDYLKMQLPNTEAGLNGKQEEMANKLETLSYMLISELTNIRNIVGTPIECAHQYSPLSQPFNALDHFKIEYYAAPLRNDFKVHFVKQMTIEFNRFIRDNDKDVCLNVKCDKLHEDIGDSIIVTFGKDVESRVKAATRVLEEFDLVSAEHFVLTIDKL